MAKPEVDPPSLPVNDIGDQAVVACIGVGGDTG